MTIESHVVTPEPRPLRRVGNCQILEEIGSGGMATVYRAMQQPLGRVVAVKALKPAVAGDSLSAARFEREAHFMASLQHENILHVHDFLRQDNSMFIVMEYVRGIDLFDLLERCRILPVDVAAVIALSVARALDYAHFRGIVHRDVKPANVMISRHGEVKLMDFGIAHADTQLDLTEAGTGLGTPSYMSPEQILGDKLDFRSDVFSLGIVLYQLVTGQKPFVEDEHHTVLQKIRLDRYTSPRKLNPEVPRKLEQILARCMEKLPERRYPSTQALIDDLTEFLAARVPMNHSAKLVMFLGEIGFIPQAEANQILAAAGSREPRRRAPGPGSAVRQLALATSSVLVLGALLAGALSLRDRPGELTQLTSGIAGDRGQSGEYGYLQVTADPWAEVYADGHLLAVTPTAERLWLRPGRHALKFAHPQYPPIVREVEVVAGTVQQIDVRLSSPERAGTP